MRKVAIKFPELELPRSERRQRARHFARLKAGANPLTPRQVKRLSNSVRKAWKAQRAARKRGWSGIAELMAAMS